LFEVKILHEYYLTDSDGANIFDHPLQKDRINFLRDRFLKGDANINEEIKCVLPVSSRRLFKDYRLKLVPNYAGFKVAIEVIPNTLGDGTTTYQPKVQLPANTALHVLLAKKNNYIDAFTNGRMNRRVDARFYFSSEEFSGGKAFPFLTNGIPDFDAAFSFEQGELATHGVNDIRAFYKDTADSTQWLNLNGAGYANERDRLLVPLGFNFAITSANSTTVDFVLKDSTNTVRAEYHFKQSEPIRKVFITVNRNDVLTVPENVATAPLFYTLEASGNNGYADKVNLIFYNGEERVSDSWALVQVNVKNANSNFDLLDAQGLLKTRRKANGTFDPLHPIFEIRVRSKFTFWRYVNDENKDFQNNLHGDQLELIVGRLVSKKPRPLSHSPVFFKKPDNSAYYLPNPRPHDLVRSESGRLYSDVFVSESKDMFPLGP
jgi:hypothetical protein